MDTSVKTYKELCGIQDEIVELQKRVNNMCHDLLHDKNFHVVASFKVALMSAMCEMNEAMSNIEL